MYIFAPGNGEMPEWSNGADSKSVELLMWFLGFESLSLRNKGCKSSNYEIYTLYYTQN